MAENEKEEPTRSAGFYKKAGDKTVDGFKNPTVDDMNPESWWNEANTGEETAVDPSEVNVPEIETQVVDLPEEDVNEKKLVVDHKDDEPDKTVVEPLLALQDPEIFDDMEVIDPVDVPVEEEQSVDPAEVGEGAEIEKPEGMEENELGETSSTENPEEKTLTEEEKKKQEEKEKRKLARKEARALAQDNLKGFKFPPNWEDWTPKQKADAIKAWNNKRAGQEEPVQEEPIQEEPKKEMTKDEAMAEARMIAQDPLDGVVIDPKLWSQFTTKEKLDFIKMLQEKNKDVNNYVDEDTTNNYESYKRYPTALKVAEDVAGVAGDIGNRVERVGNKQLAGEGGTSINDAVRQASIPHYDYRRFFR